MSAAWLSHFRQIWLVDTEFHQPAGCLPQPLCLVAREFRSGRTLRFWANELAQMRQPPFELSPDILLVAFYSSAELGCFLALGWPMPARLLDLYAEFRNRTNGIATPCGNGLIGALAYFGIKTIPAAEKEGMRQLAVRGGPFNPDERRALIEYCEGDVVALSELLKAMTLNIDLPRALLRGRYMAAVARMERTGVPLDTEVFGRLKASWHHIQEQLIAEIDESYGVYEGRTFKAASFGYWLSLKKIPWPYHDSGLPDLTDDTFRQFARRYPEIAPLRELRHALSQMRLNELAVGPDGRTRCLLSPFSSRTGRNQPSTTRFIFGPSCWLRGLIKPQLNRAVAYIDWEQQEFGVAAALSGDAAMMEAYRSGDPYLAFAKQAGAVPATATKASHSQQREQFKICSLAVQYGMAAKGLAASLGESEAFGRELLRLHQRTYPKYWRWSGAAVDRAMIDSALHTTFGWRIHVGRDSNPRSLANFPVQANGAEMLRLACCLATERGFGVCAPVHDALLVEGSATDSNELVSATQAAMDEASTLVLGGFTLRSDAKITLWPHRYNDGRGAHMWDTVMRLLDRRIA